MRKLGRIRLEGFKSIRETETGLRLLNILIGANGAGKSNFISAFMMLNQLAAGHLQSFVGKAGGADALLYFGHKSTDRINVELTFGMNVQATSVQDCTGGRWCISCGVPAKRSKTGPPTAQRRDRA